MCRGCARSTTRGSFASRPTLARGPTSWPAFARRRLASGAEECYVEDLRDEFVRDFIFPTLRAGAIYNRKYLLGTSMARPLIAKRQVEVARAVGADALAHGCTGKGNDQVRFELTYMAFAPDLPVIAPWREWDIRSREDAIAYAAARNIPVAATKEKIYSRDRNLWHISHEGGVLEDPAQGPPKDVFMLSTDPEDAPNEPEEVLIGFDAGTPVSVNDTELDPVDLIAELNAIGGRHGVGRIDLVEDRMVGMKSRGVYETPGGTLLYSAHSELEQLVLDRRTLAAKDLIAPRYADIVYEGRWWTTEREAYDAFVDVTQERVTGSVALRLYKGSVVGDRPTERACALRRAVRDVRRGRRLRAERRRRLHSAVRSFDARARHQGSGDGGRARRVARRGSVGAGARRRVNEVACQRGADVVTGERRVRGESRRRRADGDAAGPPAARAR